MTLAWECAPFWIRHGGVELNGRKNHRYSWLQPARFMLFHRTIVSWPRTSCASGRRSRIAVVLVCGTVCQLAEGDVEPPANYAPAWLIAAVSVDFDESNNI